MKSRNAFDSNFYSMPLVVKPLFLLIVSLVMLPDASHAESDIASGGVDLLESRLSMALQMVPYASEHSTIVVDQEGRENLAVVSQVGDVNHAEVLQYGLNNAVQITQLGINNRALIEQFGSDNYADVLQQGVDNSASVSQYGGRSFSLEQVGDHMEVSIIQD